MVWHSTGTDEPRDQQRDLEIPGHWAEIGPDYPKGWTWTVLHSNPSTEEVDGGWAVDEKSAKAAVERWEREALTQLSTEDRVSIAGLAGDAIAAYTPLIKVEGQQGAVLYLHVPMTGRKVRLLIED